MLDDPNRKSVCPWMRNYYCYCQSTTTKYQPVWVPKARAGRRGGSPSSVCKKWTTVPTVPGTDGFQYVCRTKVNGQWMVGSTPESSSFDYCTTIGPGQDMWYSVCGLTVAENYEILCERT